ncbi:MAG: hypothetical protein WCI72_05300 [archaeon]
MEEEQILQHLYKITGMTSHLREKQDLRERIGRNGLINEINSLWETYTEDREIQRRREIMRIYAEGKKGGIAEGRSETRGNGWVWTGAGN